MLKVKNFMSSLLSDKNKINMGDNVKFVNEFVNLFSMVQNTLNLTLMVKVWGKPRYKSTTIWRISAHTCCLNFADMLIKCKILMSRWNNIVPASSLNMHFTFETYFIRVYWVYEPRKRSHIVVRRSVWRQIKLCFLTCLQLLTLDLNVKSIIIM